VTVLNVLICPFTTSVAKASAALRKVLASWALLQTKWPMVGGRLFTDVWARPRLGLFTVLVRPLDPRHPAADHCNGRSCAWPLVSTRLDR